MKIEDTAVEWDAIVVGGSMAGLSAALMLGRARRRVLVIDDARPRNRFATHMHGVLGHEGAPPMSLLAKGREEVEGYGVRFVSGTAARVEDLTDHLRVTLEDGSAHEARALIVATGLTDGLPAVVGLEKRWGVSVLHCPYCHGLEFADQHLGVLATSPASLHQVRVVRQWSDRVTLFSAALGELSPGDEAELSSRDIRIVSSPVTELLGDGTNLRAVRLGDGSEIDVDALFTLGTALPHDDFLSDLALERADLPFGMGSFLKVDPTGKTSHPRIWAAGNVVNPMANVPISIGAGSFAGATVNGALVEEDFARARKAGVSGSHAALAPASAPAPAPSPDRYAATAGATDNQVASSIAPDRYAATAGAYDLYSIAARPGQLAALEHWLHLLQPEHGPILDIGAGSGANMALVLEEIPEANVWAIEPSRAMRGLALSRLAHRPDWFERVTLWPDDFFSALLPERIGGAVMTGVIGHFDPGERAAVLAELADRLPSGGVVLLDLQDPEIPARVEPYAFTAASIGELNYRGIAEGWPIDHERMRWRMTYLTLEGERVLTEETAEHEYHHPSPTVLIAEAEQVGLHARRLDESTFWLLTRA